MSWKKSTAAMIERFDRLLPDDPRVERRTMFGCPMATANGNLYLGLHENRFLIRLADDDRAVFIKEFKAKPFEPTPGRKSSATLVVPDQVAAAPAALRAWVRQGARPCTVAAAQGKEEGEEESACRPQDGKGEAEIDPLAARRVDR